MTNEPEVTTLQAVQERSAYQALQPVSRPPHWGVDRDPGRRPGVPMMRKPEPWPNARFPPEPQRGEPSAPKHGRTNRPMPPVFSTAMPMRGLPGMVRRLAARHPDHHPSYWLLKMLGDRVESWTHRAKKVLPVAVPLAIAAVLLRREGR